MKNPLDFSFGEEMVKKWKLETWRRHGTYIKVFVKRVKGRIKAVRDASGVPRYGMGLRKKIRKK